MTTCIWDGKRLITDSQSTCEGRRGYAKKLYNLEKGGEDSEFTVRFYNDSIRAISFNGILDHVLEYLAYKSGWLDYEFEGSEETGFIAVGYKYVYEGCTDKGKRLHRYPLSETVVEGSGAVYALAALACGKSSIAAIECAAKLDIYTDNKLQIWKS